MLGSLNSFVDTRERASDLTPSGRATLQRYNFFAAVESDFFVEGCILIIHCLFGDSMGDAVVGAIGLFWFLPKP